MSDSGVTRILERLAVIETKIDLNADLRWRVRTLEIVAAVLVVVVLGYAAGVDFPVIGGG